MTANKNLKRRVRARARRTGESYTAALMHLRRQNPQEQAMQWQRIEKPEFGYAVHVPSDWTERPPNLRNSPWETARFGQDSDRRRGMVVFRKPIRPGRSAVQVAELVQVSLEAAGFAEFAITEVPVAGQDGVRLDCVRRDAGRVWAVSEFFAVCEAASFCLGCGSSLPEEDAPLFHDMARRFELLGPE